MKRKVALVLHIVSLGLWIPGIFMKVLTIKIGAPKASGLLSVITSKFSETKSMSIVGTIQELFSESYLFLGSLVLFFALLVPLLKSISLTLALLFPSTQTGRNGLILVRAISKWAMADVFAVGLIIAFLTFKNYPMVQVFPGYGLYFFASYVIVSTSAAYVCPMRKKKS
jgi:paraquat-inducible protein A